MHGSEINDLRKEVKKYIDEADERMVKIVYAMLEADKTSDWWDDISEGEKDAIAEGLKQIKEGKTTPHEVVMAKYSKWLKK